MRKLLFFLFIALSAIPVVAQEFKSPQEFLGYEIGSQFSRHSDVVAYFDHVAQQSSWVTYQEYGHTYERRPLTYAIISTPENLNNIERIRANHLQNAGIQEGDATSDKAIVWLSYNVHGNEASSTEAAMSTLYKLLTEKKEWLKNTVVILDPCVNPDGRDRYANWYNMVKSTPYNVSQDAAEHHEPWPGGRPNHYLFDLNRDWAWASQIETQQRLKIYNTWMPHVHVDFHEQGINEPYYFAPAAEPFHEVITDFQRDFQTEIGKNHAKYFDKEGWLFFTKERFDLLYPSYGDTYPIYMGAIGMTYEQAGHGRAGLGINTDEGFVLTLKDRIAHHTTTGLSTIEVAANNIDRLNTQFKSFFTDQDELEYKSYVLKGNQGNINALTQLLDMHDIAYGFVSNGKVSGYNYQENKSGQLNYEKALVVSTNQAKGKMVQVLFEPNASLSTPLTYDITAWSLPHAYGLEAVASKTLVNATQPTTKQEIKNLEKPSAAGYIAKWDSFNDAKFLTALLKEDIRVRFSEKNFSNNKKQYERGTLILTKSDNRTQENFHTTVVNLANEYGIQLDATETSFASAGPDFGSPKIKMINKPRIALLKGAYTSSLSYGALWYYFEQELKYPITHIDSDYFSRINWSNYDILIVPNGYYNGLLDEGTLTKIKSFVRSGGKIIALGNALKAFEGKDSFGLKENNKENTSEDEDKNNSTENLIPYADREMSRVPDMITGSIFKTQVDKTHPLAFGYGDTYFSLKLGSTSYSFLEDGYNVAYIKEPKSVSGFTGKDALEGLKNSLVFGEQRLGRGSLVYMVDDPLFRAFWQNGKLFFANAIFFVNNNKPTL